MSKRNRQAIGPYDSSNPSVDQQRNNNNAPPTQQPQQPLHTALSLAQASSKAGFLTTSQQKSRFFVIDSSTHFYYFLTPHDAEPRGCLPLEGSRIEPHATDPCSLVITCPRAEPVILHARSSSDAWEWIRVLREERVEAKNEALRKSALQRSGWKSRVGELEKEVETLKLVEADRDGALEDAENWKRQFEGLDEALRTFTLQLSRQEEDQQAMEGVPGCHFSALHNSVTQLQQNLALASQESTAAIQDVGTANEKALAAEKRLEQADKHLCNIWEENCALRKLLKQTRREKRVLVREVKLLREQQQEEAETADLEEDEDKLIQDIEDHLRTSIKLHEDLLTASGLKEREPANEEEEDALDLDTSRESVDLLMLDNSVTGESVNKDRTEQQGNPIASLFDVNDDESSGTEEEYPKERPNPLLQRESVDTPVTMASTDSGTSTTAPTSRLSCPLADVVSSAKGTTPEDTGSQVYHLTFYSRKIGLQFQKAPPPPVKAKGLLTEALTSDLTHVPSAGEKTAAELRRIANISTNAKELKFPTVCDVATPVDAVLVCGFFGFDDSAGNVRPKLGARLVAFDGVSVEVGKWTFDAVRKSIQARDRPLTLSFRNDYLTLDQRKILTKAVQDVEKLSPPPHRTVEYRPSSSEYRPSSSGPPSVQSVMTHRSSEHDDDVSFASTLPARSVSTASNNLRSFSEAGSSTSVLSAVGPLVSNLLKKKKPFSPEYLRRPPVSVEQSPQHHDFQSELL